MMFTEASIMESSHNLATFTLVFVPEAPAIFTGRTCLASILVRLPDIMEPFTDLDHNLASFLEKIDNGEHTELFTDAIVWIQTELIKLMNEIKVVFYDISLDGTKDSINVRIYS